MTMGTTPRTAEGLSTHIGINAFNNRNPQVKRPQTCILPDLYVLAEKHDVILAASPLGRDVDWLLFPGDRMQELLRAEELPPSVLMLRRSANRKDQLEAFEGLKRYFEAGGAQ